MIKRSVVMLFTVFLLIGCSEDTIIDVIRKPEINTIIHPDTPEAPVLDDLNIKVGIRNDEEVIGFNVSDYEKLVLYLQAVQVYEEKVNETFIYYKDHPLLNNSDIQ